MGTYSYKGQLGGIPRKEVLSQKSFAAPLEMGKGNPYFLRAQRNVPHLGRGQMLQFENVNAKPTATKNDAVSFTEQNPGLIEGLKKVVRNDFAASLVSQFERKGTLSIKQIEAGYRLLNGAQARAATIASAPTIDMSKINDMFSKARESGLKRLVFSAADLKSVPLRKRA